MIDESIFDKARIKINIDFENQIQKIQFNFIIIQKNSKKKKNKTNNQNIAYYNNNQYGYYQ